MTLHIDPTIEARLCAREDAVPLFWCEETAAAEIALTTTPALAPLLAAHFATTPDPLSPASLAALDARLSPYLSEWGYTPDRGNRDTYLVFRAEAGNCSPEIAKAPQKNDETDLKTDKTHPKTDKTHPQADNLSTVLLKLGDKYQNLTTIDLPRALGAGCVAYGYIACGRILALAITHTAQAGAAAEVTLETAHAYRGRGYGKAALAALTRHLLNRGMTITYRTRENNIPSARAALACGYAAAGRFYRYLGRRV